MKKVLFCIFCFTVSILLDSTTVRAQEWSEKQKEIWSVVEKSWSDWKSGNATDVLATIHDSYQGWSADQPLPLGKEQVSSMYEWMAASVKTHFYLINPARIVVEDNVALVHYYYAFSADFSQMGGAADETVEGKNTEVYIKHKGNWMLLGDMTLTDDDGDDDDDDD